jgi:hypothetical protein
VLIVEPKRRANTERLDANGERAKYRDDFRSANLPGGQYSASAVTNGSTAANRRADHGRANANSIRKRARGHGDALHYCMADRQIQRHVSAADG